MTKSNIPALRNDCALYLSGTEQAEGGRAALSIDLVDYLATPIVYTYSEKDGTEYKDDFAVHELITNKPRNAKGEFHKTLQGHRREALLINLFGFESWNIPAKMQSAIDRLVPEAIALRHYYGRDDGSLAVRMVKVPGSMDKTSRRVIGLIPAGDMFGLVDDNGAATSLARKAMRQFPAIYRAHKKRDHSSDAELLEFMLTYPVEADGKANSLFDGAKTLTSAQFLDRLVKSAREEGVLPALDKRATNAKEKAATDMKGAVSTVLASLNAVLAYDESEVTLSSEVERLMDDMAERWAAYRAMFPRHLMD